MTDDEQLEQAIRDAEAELARLRRSVERRVIEAMEQRGLSREAVVARRDQRHVELQSARRELRSAERQRDRPRGMQPHQFVLRFTGVCWFYLSIPMGRELQPIMLRLIAGAGLALVTFIVGSLTRNSDEP